MSIAPGTVLKPLVKLPRSSEGCWEWQGHCNTNGVPMKQVNGAPIAARRWLWESLFGQLPPGLIVYGTCGNLRCVNPHHMRCGLHADQNQQNHSDLTPFDVAEIKRAKRCYATRVRLSQRLGVSEDVIKTIWRGASFKRKPHVRAPVPAAVAGPA